MKIEYSSLFLKDLKKLKYIANYLSIKRICFNKKKKKETLLQVKNIKKIKGYISYYRIRIGDYRVGIKEEEGTIILMRVLHRKDIYKFFPNL